ncbi:MAG: hypothetical protein A2Y33_15050 [Spirochaetes bacterium GWF1_51_8]|nr:MAG: hypothetical protein A2Y33_15050 [Spirochaetes bacterium GWF1_51_8]
MKLDLTTPALLFPAISLLLLAYTNRFLTLANLVRELHAKHKEAPDQTLLDQIRNLSLRIGLIRYMQALGILSFIFCVFCMFLLFMDIEGWVEYTFSFALLLLMASLVVSFIEITISSNALKVQLKDCQNTGGPECKTPAKK